MSLDKDDYYIQRSGTISGRYIRTNAASATHEFVLVEDTVHSDTRLHILGDRPYSITGLYVGDVQALRRVCDLFLKAHDSLASSDERMR